MRKSFAILSVTASYFFWTAFAAAQPAKVAIGYSGISADQLVIWIARDAGIFAKNKTLKRFTFPAGQSQSRR